VSGQAVQIGNPITEKKVTDTILEARDLNLYSAITDCGAGGLSEGFRQAGFHVLAGNDIGKFAGETFAATHPEAAFFGKPIEKISAKDFLNATGLKQGELDCLVGGPWFPGGLIADLEDLLSCQVQVVTEQGLNAHLRDHVLAEAVPL